MQADGWHAMQTESVEQEQLRHHVADKGLYTMRP